MNSGKRNRWTYLGLSVQGDLGGITSYTSRTGKLVVFPRASPLNPPTPAQELAREIFRSTAAKWRSLTRDERKAWLRIARATHLAITGYNLFTWYVRTGDRHAIASLERQAGIALAIPA